MRTFDYAGFAERLLTVDIVNQLSAIHENKGKQSLYLEAKPDVLSAMVDVAKVQSTQSSNRIEGIHTSDARVAELVALRTEPRNRSEQEIAGYRDVLSTIHENFEHIPVRPNIILQLHRDLYRYSGSALGGRFKTADNTIEEVDARGNRAVRFQPLPAYETPAAMEQLCDAYARIIGNSDADPLLLIPLFVLDFLCIHPFSDGNGRMSRLLTLLLLYQAGYVVGRYISLEMLVEQSKESYYDALQLSSADWQMEKNDPRPFVQYMLGIVLRAYQEFTDRVALMSAQGMTAAQRIAELLRERVGSLSKKQLVELAPDLHPGTVERALTELVKAGAIRKIGAGRATAYVHNGPETV